MITGKTNLEIFEDQFLAPYAAHSRSTRGRVHDEKSHSYRSEFQRDRERIIHSRAFRRLEYKTQVFINHEGDHYRTRLTHTMEVAQIARAIARALRLNEDLAESIALAHDLGHTPFGHVGEKELNLLLKDNGGFEHNRQSLRVVEELEHRYSSFKGLNLTWETREGLIKHSGTYDRPGTSNYSPEEQPSLEAQIIDYADEIAYNNHDLDDGLTSGLLNFEEVRSLNLWRMAEEKYQGELPSDKKMHSREIIRVIINLLVTDFIEYTDKLITQNKIQSYEEVKKLNAHLTGFTDEINNANNELKLFLMNKLYRHHKVTRMSLKSKNVINELFNVYTEFPETLPERYQEKSKKEGLIITVSDFIAGMTDRFAIEEHSKLTDPFTRV